MSIITDLKTLYAPCKCRRPGKNASFHPFENIRLISPSFYK